MKVKAAPSKRLPDEWWDVFEGEDQERANCLAHCHTMESALLVATSINYYRQHHDTLPAGAPPE